MTPADVVKNIERDIYCARAARTRRIREMLSGCMSRVREANWRCWATLSAIRRRAPTLSSYRAARWDVRVGSCAEGGAGVGGGWRSGIVRGFFLSCWVY